MLFKEVSKGIGTKCVPASDEEVEKAKKQYKETKNVTTNLSMMKLDILIITSDIVVFVENL